MTKSTWKRIGRLDYVACDISHIDGAKSEAIDACVDRMYKRAGIDLYKYEDWDLIDISYDTGDIIITGVDGTILERLNVFSKSIAA